jgi:hypothetical protein
VNKNIYKTRHTAHSKFKYISPPLSLKILFIRFINPRFIYLDSEQLPTIHMIINLNMLESNDAIQKPIKPYIFNKITPKKKYVTPNISCSTTCQYIELNFNKTGCVNIPIVVTIAARFAAGSISNAWAAISGYKMPVTNGAKIIHRI